MVSEVKVIPNAMVRFSGLTKEEAIIGAHMALEDEFLSARIQVRPEYEYDPEKGRRLSGTYRVTAWIRTILADTDEMSDEEVYDKLLTEANDWREKMQRYFDINR